MQICNVLDRLFIQHDNLVLEHLKTPHEKYAYHTEYPCKSSLYMHCTYIVGQ